MGRIMIFGDSSTSLSGDFYYKERKYPLKFYREYREISVNEYVIPHGFIFEYIPPDVSLKSKWLDVSVRYVKDTNVIKQVINKHYKKVYTPASGYKEFKDFLQKAEDSLNERIIIRKNE